MNRKSSMFKLSIVTCGLFLFSLFFLTGCGGGGGGGYTGSSTGIPGVPQNVAANQIPADPANNVLGGVVVSWNPVSGATSYIIYYAQCTSCALTKKNYGSFNGVRLTVPGGNTTSHVFSTTDLVSSLTYSFVVTAINTSGEGGESQEVSAVVPS